MAKKSVPLRKPAGSDGQGNIKVPGGPVVLDLGDFDDIFGPMESESPKQGPLGQFYTGLKDSLSDRFKTKDIVRNFLRSAAPDGISNVMGFADEAMAVTRDIKESLERTNAADLQYIAKKAQQILPQVKDYVSEDTYNNISEGLENKIDEYDYTIQSGRDQTAIRRARQEESDSNQIKAAMDNIALTERLNHNKSEQAANARHNQSRAENSIRDVLTTKRFDFMAKSMGMAVDSLQRLAGYNEQVDYGFQRKGLELQFRSYLGIKELVKLSEAHLELNARAYNSIVRNTALADHQKTNRKDLGQIGNGQSNSRGFASNAARAIGGKTLSQFYGNYSGNVQSRVTDSLSQKLGMAVQAIKMGEAGPNLWDNKYSFAGGIAGDFLSDFLLNDLVPMMGREARSPLTKLSNKYGGRHNQAGYLMDNMPAFMQEFVNNNQNQHGWKGSIRNLIAPYVPQFGLQDRLQNGTFQTIDQHAAFNQATQRSIVDAIPGYLARILQEMRMIRTGSDQVAREVFDMTTGKFGVEANMHDNIQNRILPENAVRSASATINDALNQIDKDGKLSAGARKALGERLLRDSSSNQRFDPEAYIRTRGYAQGTSPEVAAELEQHFRGQFEFDNKGKMADTAANHQLRQEFSQAFLDIRSISRDPIKEINRMINSGHTEPLRALGIIVTEKGYDRINYPRIWEILRSGVTGHNPYAPGGDGNDPNTIDRSGEAGHKSFMGPQHPGLVKAFAANKLDAFRTKYAPEEQAARDAMAKHLKAMRGRFGSASKNVQETFADLTGGKGTDYTPGIQSFSKMMSAGPGFGPQNLGGGYSSFVGQAVDDHKDSMQGYVANGMQQLTDLYSSFDPTQPVIKGIDFSMGDLIDINTKKIITKPSDITGEVINRLGQTVVTATEAAAGLLSPKGEVIVKAVEAGAAAISKAIGLNRKTNQSESSTDNESTDPNGAEQLNKQDWSLGPGENPIITARGMLNGDYRDAAGKIIDSIADISSDVYDKTGNLVLTAKEFANGLWSKRTGKRYRPTKGLSKLLALAKGASKFSGTNATSMGFAAMKFAGKAALGVASAAFNFVMDNQNAYLPGEPVPVITRRQLQAGEYYDDKGKTIEDFADVYSPIYNAQGEAVIAPELYKQLTNFDGSKHVLAKNRRIWAKFIMRPIRAVRDAYMRQTKRYYKWLGKTTAKAGGWLGGKLFGGFAKRGSNLLGSAFDSVEDPNTKAQIDATLMASQQQTSVMEQVLQAIQDLKPKELRKGSWQEQAARKMGLGSKDPKAAGKDGDEKQAGFLKRGLAGLASMLGLGNKGEDDDDDGFGLEDAADLADIGDAAGNARERGRRRRGGKRGWFGRMWDKAKGSKLGKWGGGLVEKAGQSRLGQMAGRGLAMAGESAAGRAGLGVVTQVAKRPTLWTAVAAASVGMGAYLYSSIKSSSGEFRRLRLAQYGIRGMRRELKVLELEALLEKYTDKNSDSPSFSLNGAGAKDILSIMGIDLDNQAEVQNFAKWLDLRFKPVYLAWIGGLNKIGQSQVKINEIDDKVPKELKADLLDSVRFPYNGDTPYAVLVNPFDPDDTPEPNAEYISKMFDELKAEYDPERKAAEAKVDKKGDGKGTMEKAAAAGTIGTAVATGNAAKDLVTKQAAAGDKNSDVLKTPLAATAAAASSMSGTIANLNERIGNSITGLQAIRMRAYGVQTLHLSDVRSLLALEAVYAKDLTAVDGVVDYNGDESKLLAAAGALLGKDTSVGSSDRPKLYNWLVQRFGPTFRAYYGTAKGLNPSAELKSMESKLSGADKVTVGQAVMGAVYRHDQTVWDSESIFDVKGPLSDLKRLADADLEQLRKDSAKEVIDSPTQKGSDQMAGKNAAETGGSFADKVVGTIKDTWNKTTETVSGAWNRASDAAQDTYAGAKIAIGMGPDYGEGGAKGGAVKSTGTGGTMLSGTGGKFEELPYPSANGSIKAAYPTLLAAGKMTGVPVDWLTVIAGIESNFNYDIKASTSSATGWYQFIDSTWDQVVKQYGAKYGIPGKQADPERKARKDPRASALMGAEFIKANYATVSKGIGRNDLTDTDIYMAHFLGPGGAIKFLKADPNAMAYKIFSKEYSANMAIFFVNSKPSQPRTISDVYKLFQAKMDKFWNTVGKGYRQGSGESPSNTANADAQTPGAVENSQTADEAAMKDKLKAEASNKDGMGSDTKGEQPAGGNSDIKQGDGTGSVQSLARNTAPMPGAPATGGGSSSSVSNTGTDSGAGTADSQQQAQLDAAQAQNTRRAAEVKRDQNVAADVNDIQVRQLNTLFEIRDLTQLQLDNSKDLLKAFTGGQSAGGQGSGNNMNPSTMQGRPAAQRESSVTLR
ncbi:tail fiber protein [Pseudomonas phage 201phi2-1]|uniref:Virion structural protein n=1 Tax=Pseudomonas phage 201phi2-1 TaxID=198110 RepID=B3FJD7_BP201|nr:tail fiber protein [Pseudomonas phage 201phi2-1]ABY63103.1 virion structural protein [Pseudomonas phage 201phi2-1]